jgi:hypothetical protein
MAYGDPSGLGQGGDSGQGEFGAGPAPAVPSAVPSAVTIAGTLFFVGGGLTLLSGLLLFGIASLGALFALLAVVYLALGDFEIYLGLQLRKLVPWSRSAAILLSAGSIVISLLLVSRGGAGTVLGMILPAVVIYLMYRPETRAVFPRSTKPLGI